MQMRSSVLPDKIRKQRQCNLAMDSVKRSACDVGEVSRHYDNSVVRVPIVLRSRAGADVNGVCGDDKLQLVMQVAMLR